MLVCWMAFIVGISVATGDGGVFLAWYTVTQHRLVTIAILYVVLIYLVDFTQTTPLSPKDDVTLSPSFINVKRIE